MATTYARGVRVIDHIVPMNPHQKISGHWRWGPLWEADGRAGYWIVEREEWRPYRRTAVAIRVELDDNAREIDYRHFSDRLADLRDGSLDVDDALAALDRPKGARKPRRPAVPKVMAADIAALNELARRDLS
jgi:hypothetical protein